MIQLQGDWKRCGMLLKGLSLELFPLYKIKLFEDSEMVVEKMQSHIDKQDLPWAELSEVTKRLKEDERIYIETGYLRENIGVRKIKSSQSDVAYFIGASPWKTHTPSGRKFSEIMMYMEYGTIKQPARPLVRPTFDEVKNNLRKEWTQYLKDMVRRY